MIVFIFNTNNKFIYGSDRHTTTLAFTAAEPSSLKAFTPIILVELVVTYVQGLGTKPSFRKPETCKQSIIDIITKLQYGCLATNIIFNSISFWI